MFDVFKCSVIHGIKLQSLQKTNRNALTVFIYSLWKLKKVFKEVFSSKQIVESALVYVLNYYIVPHTRDTRVSQISKKFVS